MRESKVFVHQQKVAKQIEAETIQAKMQTLEQIP